MSYILTAILLYLLFRFIVGFVLPIARATSQVKKQFNSMREQAEAGQSRQNGFQQADPRAVNQKPKYDMEGEYIQYEDLPPSK